ncbi:MAG TPA: hypothetical protein VK726_01275 [Acetobacteraceae bacterium]|nr:hypothetical protein [Acetobacteraceae bacterium]
MSASGVRIDAGKQPRAGSGQLHQLDAPVGRTGAPPQQPALFQTRNDIGGGRAIDTDRECQRRLVKTGLRCQQAQQAEWHGRHAA